LSDIPIFRNSHCLCCGGRSFSASLAILSAFLSSRAFRLPPTITTLYECLDCGFRWSKRGLSDDEVSSLYVGYRDELYFIQRSSFEPWYSREINDGIGSELAMPKRRKTLMDLLRKCDINLDGLKKIADHGGDRGQMLLSFTAQVKKVYDISGASLDPGIERIENIQSELNNFDLVLSCHVLEHLNDPKEGLLEALSLVKGNGLIYLELPNEIWTGPYQPPFQRKLLTWLASKPRLLMCSDFICTAFRVKLKFIPPLGFLVIREHLQYFTIESIKKLMTSNNLEVLAVERSGDFLIALGRKFN